MADVPSLKHQQTSDSVKQLMFERDLELEMLRRKKHYQTSASGRISFLFFQIFSFLFWGHKSAARLLPDRFLCCRILRRKEGRLKSNDAKAVGIHLKCDQSSLSKERINFVHDNSLKGWPNMVDWSGKLYDWAESQSSGVPITSCGGDGGRVSSKQ